MSEEFIIAAKRELADLEAELMKNVMFRRWVRVKETIDEYGGGGTDEGESHATRQGRQPSPERLKALKLAEYFLRNRAEPTPTREIVKHVQAHNVEIGGKDPVSYLSALLSNSELFQSHGRSGWVLKEKPRPWARNEKANHTEATPQELIFGEEEDDF